MNVRSGDAESASDIVKRLAAELDKGDAAAAAAFSSINPNKETKIVQAALDTHLASMDSM